MVVFYARDCSCAMFIYIYHSISHGNVHASLCKEIAGNILYHSLSKNDLFKLLETTSVSLALEKKCWSLQR